MRIDVDLALCQSHGECAYQAPEVFRLNDDNELEWNASPPEELREACLAAADACPMGAITVGD